jgi:hypothetical protein
MLDLVEVGFAAGADESKKTSKKVEDVHSVRVQNL